MHIHTCAMCVYKAFLNVHAVQRGVCACVTFFGCLIAFLHTFCGKIAKNCYYIVTFKSLVSNWLTVLFQNWVICIVLLIS